MRFNQIARNYKLWLKADPQNRYIQLVNKISKHEGRLFYRGDTPTPGIAFLVQDSAVCPVVCLDDESHNDWVGFKVELIPEPQDVAHPSEKDYGSRDA